MSPTTTHLLSLFWDCATELAFWLLVWGAASGVLFLGLFWPLLAIAGRVDRALHREPTLGEQAEILAASHAARRADAIHAAARRGVDEGTTAPVEEDER